MQNDCLRFGVPNDSVDDGVNENLKQKSETKFSNKIGWVVYTSRIDLVK